MTLTPASPLLHGFEITDADIQVTVTSKGRADDGRDVFVQNVFRVQGAMCRCHTPEYHDPERAFGQAFMVITGDGWTVTSMAHEQVD